MASRIGSKKGYGSAVSRSPLCSCATAIPGLAAASQRTIALAITVPPDGGCGQHQRGLPREGDEQLPRRFRVEPKLDPGDGSARVHGDRCRLACTQASGESTNANHPSAIDPSKTSTGTVTVNSIKPLQRLQFVTVLITATTPSTRHLQRSGTQSGPWSAAASTGSTYGQGGGQPFTLTTTPPTTSLTKSCSAPTITIAATTPTTYTAVGATDDASRRR